MPCPHLQTALWHRTCGRLLKRRSPQKRKSFRSPALAAEPHHQPCPPQNLWFALRAGFSTGASSCARCIPLLQLPINSGCVSEKPFVYPVIFHCSNVCAAFKGAPSVPRSRPFERSSPSSKWAGRIRIHRPTTSLRWLIPVVSFVCANVPGTTRSTHPPPGLPCPGCVEPAAHPT